MGLPNASTFSTYAVGYPYSQTGAGVSVIGTREDAINTLTMIDPDEAMTLAVLQKTTTNGLRHEWFTDVMQAIATAPALQGEDWGASNNKQLKVRTRLWNYVQWFRQDWSITTDELLLSERGQIFGVPNEQDYQTGKGGMEVTRNIDARLWSLGGALYGSVVGTDAVAAQFANFRAFASIGGGVTAALAFTGGAFATASFYDLQERMWTAGAKPDTLFVSPGVKSDISRTLLGDAGTTINSGLSTVRTNDVISGGEYGPVIDFIRTDFGRVAMVVDRWLPQQSVTGSATVHSENAAYFLVEKSKLRVAFWRPIKPYQVASTGDNVKLYCLGACTVEILHPTALGHCANIIT